MPDPMPRVGTVGLKPISTFHSPWPQSLVRGGHVTYTVQSGDSQCYCLEPWDVTVICVPHSISFAIPQAILCDVMRPHDYNQPYSYPEKEAGYRDLDRNWSLGINSVLRLILPLDINETMFFLTKSVGVGSFCYSQLKVSSFPYQGRSSLTILSRVSSGYSLLLSSYFLYSTYHTLTLYCLFIQLFCYFLFLNCMAQEGSDLVFLLHSALIDAQ